MPNHCCGFRLQTGGIIIGSLEAVGGLIGTLICSVLLVLLINEKEYVHKMLPISNKGFLAQNEILNSYMTVLLVAFLVLSIFQMIISFLLIYAVQKKSSELMTSWMVFKLMFTIFVVFMLFCSIVNLLPLKVIIFYLTVIGLTAFYLDIIYSLQRQIKSEVNGLPIYAAAQTQMISEANELPSYIEAQNIKYQKF